MKKLHRSAALFLTLLCVSAAPVVFAEAGRSLTAYAAEITDSGTCGKNAKWQLDSAGTLTISGTGRMDGNSDRNPIPWKAKKDSIKKVVITQGITNVGDQSFDECKNLTSVSLADTVTVIGSFAFSGCEALTEIVLPDSVTAISTFAFTSCKSLTDIRIPASVTRIGSLAFSGTPWMDNEIRKSPFVIVNGILIYGPDSEEIVIPSGVTYIVSNAFYGRRKVRKLTIPDTVTVIEYNAFVECSGLVSVTIPESVEDVGMQAFCGCTALEAVTILNPDCKIYDRATTFSNDNTAYTGVIRGYDGSTAEAYAKKYEYRFESLGLVPVRGDVTRDGIVSVEDAQLTLKAYTQRIAGNETGLTAAQIKAADVNGDGEVSVDDAQYILRYYTEKAVAGRDDFTWEDLIDSKRG